MPDSLYILGELFRNLGLLAIIVVGQTIVARTLPKRWQSETLTGLLFGGAAVVAMANTFEAPPGHIVDVRNVVTALAGPCGGIIAAVLTASLAALYRYGIGGPDVQAGIAGIVAATLIGLLFQVKNPRLERWSWSRLLVLGLTVSVTACAMFLLSGPAVALLRLERVGLPWVTANTLGIVLLGALLREAAQRQSTLQSLSASLEQFSTVFHSAFNYLLLLDRNGRVLQANDTALRVAGFSSRDLGRQIWESSWWADDQCKNSLHEFVTRAAEGEVVRAQAAIRGNSGGRVDLSLKRSNIVEGSEPYLLLEARDITELLAQQEQLQHSERLRAVGQLVSGIAHEFNNLLLLIASNAELLQGRGDRDSDAAGCKLLETVRQARDLTHRLLSFSGRQQLAPQTVDLCEVARSTVALAKKVLPETISLELRAESSVQANVDPRQMELALLNLILNARDAAAPHIAIEVSREMIHPEEADRLQIRPGSYASLIVSDTGTGMKPEVAAKAFEPFFTTKPIGQGTGLGLSMVHGFVLQSGGHVSLESETGIGTAIRLLLPSTASASSFRHEAVMHRADLVTDCIASGVGD
jgi:PAS domain S-box-containing protein